MGPQIAEKLGLPQVTYAESIHVADGKATIKRRIERGFETVECPLPLVVTVNGSADACRPRNARLIQKYKYAVTPSEKAALPADRQALVDARPYLAIKEWGVKEIEADPEQIGHRRCRRRRTRRPRARTYRRPHHRIIFKDSKDLKDFKDL